MSSNFKNKISLFVNIYKKFINKYLIKIVLIIFQKQNWIRNNALINLVKLRDIKDSGFNEKNMNQNNSYKNEDLI